MLGKFYTLTETGWDNSGHLPPSGWVIKKYGTNIIFRDEKGKVSSSDIKPELFKLYYKEIPELKAKKIRISAFKIGNDLFAGDPKFPSLLMEVVDVDAIEE